MPPPEVSPLRVESKPDGFSIFPPGATGPNGSGVFWFLPWDQLEVLRRELHLAKQPILAALVREVLPLVSGEKTAGTEYTVDDYIRLTARNAGNQDAVRYLQRWGAWWKIQSGAKGGEAWLLRSIGNQPREISKTKAENTVIWKTSDPLFAVVGVQKFPSEFNHKIAEAQYRAEQAKL